MRGCPIDVLNASMQGKAGDSKGAATRPHVAWRPNSRTTAPRRQATACRNRTIVRTHISRAAEPRFAGQSLRGIRARTSRRFVRAQVRATE